MLPIGDHFTMGPREAAIALDMLGQAALRAVPLGHVPDPHRDAGRARGADAGDVERIAPGDTVTL